MAVATTMRAKQQVTYLRDEKGVSFKLMSEARAAEYLASEGYFFKTKSYAKCFEKYSSPSSPKGRYINLDFGHLVELERLDGVLRRLALLLTGDIEHAIKVRINSAAMRSGSDPLEVSRRFLAEAHRAVLSEQVRNYDADVGRGCAEVALGALKYADFDDPDEAVDAINTAILALSNAASHRDPLYIRNSIQRLSGSRYSGGIVRKYGEFIMPYWCLMELVSFGPLISLYKQCFKSGGIIDDPDETAALKESKNLLRQAQSLRNGAAHGDALLHTLGSYSSSSSMKGVRRKLADREIAGPWVDQVASVPVAMEFASVLMAHETLVDSHDARVRAALALSEAAADFALHATWFAKTYSVASFLEFAEKTCQLFSARIRQAGEPV